MANLNQKLQRLENALADLRCVTCGHCQDGVAPHAVRMDRNDGDGLMPLT